MPGSIDGSSFHSSMTDVRNCFEGHDRRSTGSRCVNDQMIPVIPQGGFIRFKPHRGVTQIGGLSMRIDTKSPSWKDPDNLIVPSITYALTRHMKPTRVAYMEFQAH